MSGFCKHGMTRKHDCEWRREEELQTARAEGLEEAARIVEQLDGWPSPKSAAGAIRAAIPAPAEVTE